MVSYINGYRNVYIRLGMTACFNENDVKPTYLR